MATEKIEFGEKKKRLISIWNALGKDASYDGVAAEYKKQFPLKAELAP